MPADTVGARTVAGWGLLDGTSGDSLERTGKQILNVSFDCVGLVKHNQHQQKLIRASDHEPEETHSTEGLPPS